MLLRVVGATSSGCVRPSDISHSSTILNNCGVLNEKEQKLGMQFVDMTPIVDKAKKASED